MFRAQFTGSKNLHEFTVFAFRCSIDHRMINEFQRKIKRHTFLNMQNLLLFSVRNIIFCKLSQGKKSLALKSKLSILCFLLQWLPTFSALKSYRYSTLTMLIPCLGYSNLLQRTKLHMLSLADKIRLEEKLAVIFFVITCINQKSLCWLDSSNSSRWASYAEMKRTRQECDVDNVDFSIYFFSLINFFCIIIINISQTHSHIIQKKTKKRLIWFSRKV